MTTPRAPPPLPASPRSARREPVSTGSYHGLRGMDGGMDGVMDEWMYEGMHVPVLCLRLPRLLQVKQISWAKVSAH